MGASLQARCVLVGCVLVGCVVVRPCAWVRRAVPCGLRRGQRRGARLWPGSRGKGLVAVQWLPSGQQD